MRKEKHSKEFEIFDNLLGVMMYHNIVERLQISIEDNNQEEIKKNEILRDIFIDTFAYNVTSSEA